jgi:hypothetical protein
VGVDAAPECVTVAVSPRDRFSTLETCLKNILKHTRAPFRLIVIAGGTPRKVRAHIESLFKDAAEFHWHDGFLNGAQARNQALTLSRTRLTAFVDSDVYVRPDWLEPLVRCQVETGAAMVTPVILDRQNLIHTAGNDLYIFKENGIDCASMELRYANQYYSAQGSNLKRRPSDFAEVHCQLVVSDVARSAKIFDENLREFIEMDAGLTLHKAGHTVYFEPGSAVYLYYTFRVQSIEDVAIFRWKWDMEAMRQGFDHFKAKWGLDLNHDHRFERYFLSVNRRVGLFTRLFGIQAAVDVDRRLHGLIKPLFSPN